MPRFGRHQTATLTSVTLILFGLVNLVRCIGEDQPAGNTAPVSDSPRPETPSDPVTVAPDVPLDAEPEPVGDQDGESDVLPMESEPTEVAAADTGAADQSEPPAESTTDEDAAPVAPVETSPSLDELLAKIEIPPPWLADVETSYDTSQPWKEARLGHQDCNFCTEVCPTGAIQPLEIAVKRNVHMGLARVKTETCLPFRSDGRRDCDLCFVECEQAGYRAIEMRPVHIELDPPPPEGMFSDLELEEMSRINAPFVDADKCVGCGICQYRCHTRYVVQEEKLADSAIVVFAENEHRLLSYPAVAEDLPAPNTPVVR